MNTLQVSNSFVIFYLIARFFNVNCSALGNKFEFILSTVQVKILYIMEPTHPGAIRYIVMSHGLVNNAVTGAPVSSSPSNIHACMPLHRN